MPSQPHGLIDPHAALSEVIDALTVGFLSAASQSSAEKSWLCGPSNLLPYGTEQGALGAIEVGHITALADATRAVLDLHAPRKASDPGASSRCRHDNNTWPCRTFTSIASALDGVLPRSCRPERERAVAHRTYRGPCPQTREGYES